MTQVPESSGPGSSPGASDDDVSVAGGEPTVGAPLQDGAEELRREAEEARSEGAGSRADNPAASGESAQRAEQTQALDPDSGGDDRSAGSP